MNLFVVDVEADGPAPRLFSMVSFAAVRVQEGELSCNFRAEVAPISEKWVPDALAVSKVTREQHLQFEAPELVIPRFAQWVEQNAPDGAVFVSDNPAFDWQFINYYMHAYAGRNPFGHSARRIGDLCSGLHGDWRAGGYFRKWRGVKHTHDPLDDAKGNVQALIHMAKEFGIKRFPLS